MYFLGLGVNVRGWCNGYHGSLPSCRSGFDSRASQYAFGLNDICPYESQCNVLAQISNALKCTPNESYVSVFV